MSKRKNNKKANKGNQKVKVQDIKNINKEAEEILNKINEESKVENKVEDNKENKPEVKEENTVEIKEEKKPEVKKEAEEKLNQLNKDLQKNKKSNKNNTEWLINKNEDLKISDKIMKISSSMWNLQLMMLDKKYEFELTHKKNKNNVIKVRLRNEAIDLKIKFKETKDVSYKIKQVVNENGSESEKEYNKDYLELDDNIIPLDVILMPVFDFYFTDKKIRKEYIRYTEGNLKVHKDKITLDLNIRKEGYPIDPKGLSIESLKELMDDDEDNILGGSVEYFRRSIIVEEPKEESKESEPKEEEPKDESKESESKEEDETAGINKFERSFKFQPESKKSILKSVEFSVGNLGNITPIAKIEPVKLRDNTIKSISLGSVERFKMLGLSVGDEVIIKYEINNNKIIPYLDIDDTCEISGEHLIEAPTHCPFCGSELVEDPLLRCNNESCSSRVIGKILNDDEMTASDKIVAIIEDCDPELKDKIMDDKVDNKFEIVREAVIKYPKAYNAIKAILTQDNLNYSELKILQIVKETAPKILNPIETSEDKYNNYLSNNEKAIIKMLDTDTTNVGERSIKFVQMVEEAGVDRKDIRSLLVSNDNWYKFIWDYNPYADQVKYMIEHIDECVL